MNNPFFKNTGPHDISYLLKNIDLVDQYFSDEKVQDCLLYTSDAADEE